MVKSILPDKKYTFFGKALKFIATSSLAFLSFTQILGQAPGWVGGTPSILSTGPLSITTNYGINMAGTVYIAVLNYNSPIISAATIKSYTNLPIPTGALVAKAIIPINGGNIGNSLQSILDVFAANTTHSVWLVAESSGGVLQADATKLLATTKPCPSLTFLNQLVQPIKCVNQGAEAFFEVVPNANPLISGILKGTTWTLDWGDGTTVTYTSTADNDIPSVAMRTHTYSTVTNCNYIFSCGVKNPCGMTYSPQYVAVVHGRDQQSDGDGRLRVVNNANGSSTIQVCEGTESIITVRDNSIWNCQNPVLPTGFTAQPNLEPREIEWLYGRDPLGATTNTITGAVAVATLGNAPRASGRFSPVPYGPGSLAQAVTIPATCKAGEYFRIYLKNWNKCNWPDPEYIYTYVDILVIAAPPAPTAPDRVICFGDATTLTVTSGAIGTLTWYQDAGLTTVLGTGATYNPIISTPGPYNYWVTDQSLSGLMCRSKATQVTLDVIQTITNNTVSAAQNICYNTTPSSLTGTAPGGGTGSYSYQWQISSDNTNWNNIGSANGIDYSPGQMTATRWFRRIVTSGPCSYTSNSIRIYVYGALNGGQIRNNQSICYNTDPAGFTNFSSPSGGTGLAYSWEWSPAGTGSWSTISGETGLTFNEATDLTASRDYRRVTTSGAGCGTAYSNVLTMTVYADINPGSIGSNQTICSGDNPVLLTQTSAPSGGTGTYTYQWQSSTNDVDFNNVAGANSSTYDPPVLTETTYYRRNVTSGSCGTKSTGSVKITVNPLPTPAITGNTGPCLNYTEEYSTPSIAGHTYSWSVTNGHIIGASNSYKVTIKWDMASGPATVSVTERITATTCNKTVILNLTVNPAAPGAAGAITGLSNMCYAQSGVTYSIAPVANASNYVWSVPAGVNIASGQGTVSIVVNFTASAVSPVTISVYPENGCGSGGSSSKVITIYPQLNGGTIGSAQTICNGDNVAAFTSSAPATGGAGSFTYTWQYTTNMALPVGDPAWNNIASSNSETYDYGTLTTTTRFVRKAVEGTCSTPVYSNIITITVRPALNGGTVGNNQTICYGADVAAFSSSNPASGGAGSFTYQWQYTTNATAPLGDPAWSDIATETGLTYNHGTLNTTTRFVRRAIEGTCTNPVYSNIIVVTVRPQLNGGTIGTDQTICYGTDVAAFTSSNPASGGAGSFTYTWQYTTNMTIPAGDPAWVNIPASNTTTYNHGTLTATTRFIRSAVEGTCTTPVYSNEVIVTVRPALNGGIIADNQTICSGGDVAAFTSTTAATGGAGSFTYTWQYTTNMSATPGDGNWTDIGSSNNVIYNHGTLTTTTRFVRKAVDATCTPAVYSNMLTITVMPALNPGVIGSDHTICSGSDVPAFTSLAPASGGAGTFTYTWQYTTNMSALPGDGNWTDINSSNTLGYDFGTLTTKTMFVRKAEDISCTSPVYSNVVTVSINPLPVTSAITGPSVLCEDATNKVYQVANHSGSTYAWTVPPSLTVTSPPGLYFIIVDAVPGMSAAGDKITVTETIAATLCVGVPVELPVSVVSVVPGVVVNGPTSICLGDTATYSVPDNSGSTYSWSVPAGAYIISDPGLHSVEVTFKMAVTGDVSVVENSNGVCNTIHTPVTVTVNPLPTIFNLTAPMAYCASESGVTITLSGSQVGVNYQLYNSVGPVEAPKNGTGSALTWLNKLTETYHVLATNATTNCRQLMNGTVVPTVNIVDGGSIDIDQAVCENSTPAAFTSTVAGTAGGVLTYQWQRSPDNSTWTDIPGATSTVYASGPLSANTYFRRMAISTLGSSICQDPSNSVLVTVIIFSPGSIGSDISICEGTAPATAFTSVPPSGTGIFTYRWLSSTDGVNYSPAGITTETFTPGVLNVDTWFKREVTATYLTRSCIEETNYVKITVINFSPGSIGSDQTICSNTAPAAFTSVAATGDGSFTYSWESSPDGNAPWTSLGVSTATYSSPALTADRYFRRAVTSTHGGTSCTLYTNTVHVTVNDFDPGTVGPAKTICEGDNSGILNSVLPVSGDPSATFTYQWLSSTDGTNFSSISGATNVSYTSGSLLVDTYFRRQVTATLNGRACIELTPAILIQLNNLTPGSIDGTQTVCEDEIPSAFTEASAAVTDGAITYQWQESANGINGWTNVTSGGATATYSLPAALADDMWFKRIVISTLNGVACQKESNVIKVTVNNFQPGSIADNQSICENSPAAPITSISPSGDGTFTYRWRRSTDGVNFSLIGSATSETYNPGILTADTWYRRIVRSTVNGRTCVDSTNVIKITVINFDPGSITGEQIICNGDTPVALGSNLPSGDGPFTYQWKQSTDGITWTNVPSGGSLATYAPPALTQDTWYKRVVTSSDGVASCSLETDPVKITVINFNPGSIASDQTICEGTIPATFTSVTASGDGTKSYQWQISTNGTDFTDINLATNATYTSPALTQDTWFRRTSTATIDTKSCSLPTNTVFVKVIRFDPGEIGANQTICEGEIPALLTETVAASGNGTFTYLWQSSLDNSDWNNITGATNATYTPGALTQDTYFRRQVSAELNGKTCIDWTPSVIVRVNNLTPGSISGTQTICEGIVPAQLTETAAGTSDFGHTYQWQESTDGINGWINVSTGGTGANYIPPALNADTWYKRLVISTVGLKTCTEESNIVRVTVNNFNPGSIEEDQTICENTPAALLTSITPTGDGIFSYRWFRSTNGTDFNPIGGALSETYNPGILTQDTWYYREVKSTLNGKECIENTNTVVITVNNLTPGSISGDQDICEGGDPIAFTSNLPTFDGTVSYMWQSSTDGLNFTDIGATAETYDPPPALDEDTWYRRAVTSTIGFNACTEYTNPVKVTVINFAPGSIGSSQTICEGDTPAPFTSVAASGDGTKSYQWEISTDSISWGTISGAINATYSSPFLTQDTWFRRLSSATVGSVKCTEITDTIKVTVINFDPGTISGAQTICENDAPAAFTSADAGGDGIITYQWQASLDGTNFTNITGATTNLYAHGSMTTDTWFRRQATATLKGFQCTEWTDPILVTVNNMTPGSISGTQTICDGVIPAAFTSVPATGDGSITYQWMQSADNGANWGNVPSGGDVEIYIAPKLNADMWYKRIATSTSGGVPCVEESNVIMVTVNNFNPGNIAAEQTICENTAPAPFTSITPTGDGVFTYRWFRSTDGSNFGTPIPTAISETYSPGILSQDTWYFREVTSTIGTNKCIARTDTIKITVNNFVPGNITGSQTICEDSAPTEFTETAPAVSNDGSIITYQWQDSPDGIFFTDINLATGPAYASPALSADTWFRRAVKSTLGSNDCTEYSDIIKVTVINFAPGSIGSDQTICEGTAPASFTSVAASGDGTKSYQWQISTNGVAFTDINLATNATYTSPVLTQDTWFRRLSTATVGSYQCTEMTDTIQITVINFNPGTISADQTICEGDIPAEVTSPAATGDGTFAYQWQSSTDGSAFSGISGATSENYAPGALTVDTWFKRQVTATVNGMSCMKFTPVVEITVNNVLPGSIGGAQTICVNGTPSSLTSVALATGDGTISYQWQESSDNGANWGNVPSGGGSPTYAPPALTADMLYKRIAFSDVGGKICPAESNTVKITVVNFDPGSIGDDQTICEGTAPNALTSVSPSGDGSYTFKWYRSTDNSTWTLINGAESETYSPGILTQDTWYYREVIASIGATSCTANTNTVLITVNNFDPGSLDPDQTICEGGNPVLIDGVAPSGDGLSYEYQWYESIDGTVFTEITGAESETFDPPALTADTWYKRAATSHLNGNACTEETAPVRIWVNNFNPGTIGADQTICENTAPAPFTGTAPSGDGTFTYSWEYSLDGSDWDPVVPGVTTATYSAPSLTVDTWYRRVVTSSLNGFTCSEATPSVKITVNNFDPGTITADQWICEGETPASFGSESPSGDGTFTYQWQSSLNGTTWSNITGETDETYSSGPLVADTWFRRLVTSTLNGNTCTEPTLAIKVTVNNLTAGAIGSDQIICEGTPPAALTSVSPTYDGTLSYEWQSSTDGTNFAPVGGANSETYNPPALSVDTWYKRIVTSTLNVSCSKESNIVKITVNNFNPGSISADQTICEGSAPAPILSVTPTGDGVFSYRWFQSTDGTNFAEIFGALSETYNPGNLIADTWYRREVTSKVGNNTCTLVNNAVKITVNNLDPGLVTGEQVICEGVVPAPITGTAANGDGSTISYQWRISNDGVNYTDITTNGQNQNYIPGALTQDTWFLRMATSDLGGQKCTEMSGSFRVIVNNVNPGTIISDQTICNGSDPVAFISIVHGTGDGNITYEWQNSINGTDFTPIPSSNAPNYDSPALTQDNWFRRITRSDISGNICEKISNVVKVTVNEVHGGTIEIDQSICFGKVPAPLTSTDDGSGTGAVTYQWLRSGDGVIWNTVSGAVSEDYTPTNIHYADTWYKRVLISIQNGVLCQAESNSVKITVNSLPVAVLTGGETICPGDPATLTINITDGTAPYILDIENHGMVTIASSTAVIPVNPLTGVVTYKLLKVTDVYGCEAVNMIGTATFTVRELPEIVTGPVDKIICEYGVVKFDVVATGTDLVYQWYVDKKDGLGFIQLSDAGIYYGVQTPTLNLYGVTRDMDGYMFHVTVTTCGSTKQSADVKLTVNTVPEIQQHPKDTTICSTKNAAFSILATGTNLTYRWQYKKTSGGFIDVVDDGVNFAGAADSILYLTNVPGSFNNYLFRVIVDGDCGSALYSNIVALRVNVPPVPVLHPVSKPVCDGGGPVFFVGNGAGIIDSIRWQVSKDEGDTWEDLHDDAIYSGTTSQQLSLIDVPFAYNNYWYRLALKAFCETTYTNHAVLTVNKLPVVTFAQDPIAACGGVSVVITPTVSEGSGTWISHNWSGNIGPLNNYFSPAPTFKTLIADTYDLTYKVVDNNMCAGEGTVSVVVDAPDATFTQDKTMECTPAKVTFSKDMTGLKSWEWDFGDATPVNTTDATVEHVFTNTTSTAIVYRTIKLTVESMAGCKDSTTSMMTIYPAIIAKLTASDDSVCHGNQLTFTADPGANIYKWDYGDLTPEVPGINTSDHMFQNSSGSPVTRTVEVVTTSLYGCKDSTTIDIVVMPMPQAQFSATPNNQTFDAAGNDVNFTDETTPVSTWTYNWDFGNTTSSAEQNPTHKYTGIGTYNVVLTVSNGKCSSQVSHPVNILPIPPIADFDSIPSGCATWTIKPKNTSLNTEVPGTTYRWDFGDGSYSTAKEPEYTYYKPGEYRVELTVTGPGGISMKSQMVRAYPSPKAYFEVSPTLVFVNDERVRCFNLSEGGDYWVWDFGDGDTSRMREPYHKYMEEGVYDITLWAYSNNGCSDMFILSPGVTVQPAGDVRFSTVFTPNKTGPIERTDLPQGGTEMDQFFFPPIRDKVIKYKLQIFNRLGVLIFESHNINVPWNGYYKGKLCPQGVYVWYVEGKYANGEPFKKVGDITLLH